ncbi:hypothetical protein BD289DRAFT_359620, partial [Coniella lustricola]
MAPFRLIESFCTDWWFMINVTQHLTVKELVRLYSVSRVFHDLVNSRFQSTIAAWAQFKSPAGWSVLLWKCYHKYTVPDPLGTPWLKDTSLIDHIPKPPWYTCGPKGPQNTVRRVPGFQYLAMVCQRETRTRDILACLARAGHRLPRTTHVTLLKIWMLMDMATNELRGAFMRNRRLWKMRDLYNAQMFFVKLHMRFNEPMFGPESHILAEVFLGARKGLTPLWQLLRGKAYTTPLEVIQQSLRYNVAEDVVQHYLLLGLAYYGVHPTDLGEEHKEGWGAGHMHLLRPDELVAVEAVRRGVPMRPHILFMIFWGHVDWEKRCNLVPTEEEMYMSDDDLPRLPPITAIKNPELIDSVQNLIGRRCGNVPFDYDDWQPKHALKARWSTLTRAEKLAIIADDENEQLSA